MRCRELQRRWRPALRAVCLRIVLRSRVGELQQLQCRVCVHRRISIFDADSVQSWSVLAVGVVRLLQLQRGIYMWCCIGQCFPSELPTGVVQHCRVVVLYQLSKWTVRDHDRANHCVMHGSVPDRQLLRRGKCTTDPMPSRSVW